MQVPATNARTAFTDADGGTDVLAKLVTFVQLMFPAQRLGISTTQLELLQQAANENCCTANLVALTPHSFLVSYRQHCPARNRKDADHHNVKLHSVLEAACTVRLLGDFEYRDTARGEHHHIISLKYPMRIANERAPQKAIFRGVRLHESLLVYAHIGSFDCWHQVHNAACVL